MDLRFEHLEALNWLWAVAALATLIVVAWRRRRRRLERFAASPLLSRLAPTRSRLRPLVRGGLALAALVALVAGLIDPRWGLVPRPVFHRGVDVIVIFDCSRSMLAEDVRPNRLERGRAFVHDLVDALDGDRVGLIAFAGDAAITCPLTSDYAAFRLALDALTPQTVGRGGSLAGDALRLAGEAFLDDVPDHKVVLLVSDGEDHGSFAIEAARTLREERSIPVFTVGIGDADEGGRIPVEDRDGERRYLMYDGEVVWSKLDPALMRDVALAAGGAYIPVGTGTADMARLYDDRIEPMAKREFEETQTIQREPRYQWCVAIALGLLCLESLVG
ncbi:MAG: VWA domain-containing protein, partial [Phycisphaerales bacterium]|nr:VWA domain-containing protein [Phycisphaerales bacterium]